MSEEAREVEAVDIQPEVVTEAADATELGEQAAEVADA